MKTLFALAGLALLASAPATLAQSWPTGFSASGTSQLEFIDNGSSQHTGLVSKLDLSYLFPSEGALRFGVNLGAESVAMRGDGANFDKNGFYLEAVIDGGFGTLAFGRSRSAFEQIFTDQTKPLGSSLVDYELGLLRGRSQRLLRLQGNDTYGLRYEGRFADISLAASYNHVEDLGNMAELAASYPLGQVTLEGGLRYLTATEVLGYRLGAKASLGKIDAGLYSYRPDISQSLSATQFFASYQVSDQFQTSLTLDRFSNTTLTSLAMRYSSAKGIYGGLGIGKSSAANDPIYDISLGMSF
jgi:hypothetical protein